MIFDSLNQGRISPLKANELLLVVEKTRHNILFS